MLPLKAGEYRYELPEGYLRTQDIYYPNLLMRLRMTDLQQFDQVGRFEGPPARYTVYKNELWLWPTPQESGEELEHRYIKNPPQLIAETDIPVLNSNYWHLLVRYAAAEAFLAEDDFEAAAQHRQVYEKKLDAYATDVQERFVDRPHVIGGTWNEMGTDGYVFRL